VTLLLASLSAISSVAALWIFALFCDIPTAARRCCLFIVSQLFFTIPLYSPGVTLSSPATLRNRRPRESCRSRAAVSYLMRYWRRCMAQAGRRARRGYHISGDFSSMLLAQRVASLLPCRLSICACGKLVNISGCATARPPVLRPLLARRDDRTDGIAVMRGVSCSASITAAVCLAVSLAVLLCFVSACTEWRGRTAGRKNLC